MARSLCTLQEYTARVHCKSISEKKERVRNQVSNCSAAGTCTSPWQDCQRDFELENMVGRVLVRSLMAGVLSCSHLLHMSSTQAVGLWDVDRATWGGVQHTGRH